MKPVVVHTHIHKRKTGVTRSIENVLPLLSQNLKTFVFGSNIDGEHISQEKLKKFLFSDAPVVVHAHRNNELMLMLWYRFLGAKFGLVATRHSATTPSGLTKFLLKKADKVVSLTESVHHNLGIENICIPHGVNTDDFKPDSTIKLSNIRQSNIILNTGRIRKPKGQLTLVKSLGFLKNHSDWALVMVGKIDDQNFYYELQSIIKNFGIEHQVYFIPETREIVPYYQVASIFVAPSHSEGFALVTAEAMSCECTTVASENVGVHSQLIQNGKTGYLFEVGNHQRLEKILDGIISGDLKETGSAARAEITEHWSAKLEAQRLSELYESFQF